MDRRTGRSDGSLIFGLIVILVGVYYLAQNDLGLRIDVNWDLVWPVIIVVIGGLVIDRALTRRDSERPG